MACFFVTYGCGCREEIKVDGCFVGDSEGFERYMRERADSAASQKCRKCWAAESDRWVKEVERRLSLPPLKAGGAMGRYAFADARARRARVCSGLDGMKLGALDRAAADAIIAGERNAAFWRCGCTSDPARLVRHARLAYLSAEECAEMLGVSPQRVRKMLADGVLDGSKTSAGWLVSRESAAARKRANR